MSARYATPRTPTNCGAELTAFAALMSGSYASIYPHTNTEMEIHIHTHAQLGD